MTDDKNKGQQRPEEFSSEQGCPFHIRRQENVSIPVTADRQILVVQRVQSHT